MHLTLSSFVDWFVPPPLSGDAETHRRARMFVQRHFVGPGLALTLVAYLYVVDPAPGLHLLAIFAGVAVLLVFPLALRLTGKLLALSLLSMEDVLLVIFFSAYHYGGASSPLLCWLVTAPLAVVFYVGGGRVVRLVILGAIALHLAIFYALVVAGIPFPEHVPPERMAGLYVASVFCAAGFVVVMALHYASIVAEKQQALGAEVESRRATEARLREAKEEAEPANRAKSEFLAKMSHELRTPLNAIIGFSQIIAAELLGPVGTAKYAGYGSDIERSGHHLLQIISEILDLAKIETGKFVLHEAEFDLVASIRETIDLMRPLAEARGVPMRFRTPARRVRLRGDELRVKQILLNLLSNATKFTDRGGAIDVTLTRKPGAGAAVAVVDTGVGIPAHDIERVLKPFEQVGDVMISNSGGTGLGLPLAHELATLHGGTLSLVSEPGRGTEVTVTFPDTRIVGEREALAEASGR
jgi:signal transduction histidine kinase